MEDYTLEDFQARVNKDRATYSTIVAWHLQAHSTAGLKLPYQPDTTYVNVDFTDPVYPDYKKPVEVTDDNLRGWVYNYETVRNTEQILAYLKKVVKFARDSGYKITKDYDRDFTVEVTIPADERKGTKDIVIRYYCDRETVCTKKVVGTKVVPATTYPERIEEIVEWDCEKIALTA